MVGIADTYFVDELRRSLGHAAASQWLEAQVCTSRSVDGSNAGSIDSRSDDVSTSLSAVESFRDAAAEARSCQGHPGVTRLTVRTHGAASSSNHSSPRTSISPRSTRPLRAPANQQWDAKHAPAPPRAQMEPVNDDAPLLCRESSSSDLGHQRHLQSMLQAGGENAGLIFTDAAHSVFREAESAGRNQARQANR